MPTTPKSRSVSMNRMLLLAAFALVPNVSDAQTMPFVAVELARGTGSHTERAGDTWFREAHKEIFHAGAIVRLATLGSRFATIGRIEYNFGGMADQTADCPPAPNGTCRQYFPKTEGWAGGVGLTMALRSRLNVEVGVGAIQSSANRYVSAGASVPFGNHFAAMAEWRYFSLRYADDRRVTFRPIQAGIRLF